MLVHICNLPSGVCLKEKEKEGVNQGNYATGKGIQGKPNSKTHVLQISHIHRSWAFRKSGSHTV